ncbi:unnamed protein product, partial [Symbiodinium sp. CCMP2592]
PVRESKERAAEDERHLEEACREGSVAVQARARTLISEQTCEATSSKTFDAQKGSCQILVDVISQWLRQGHCNGLSRATKPLRALATRLRRLEEGLPGLCDCAKSLVSEHLAMEAVAEQRVQHLFRQLSGKDGQWDYVSPAAVLHQLWLTDGAVFQPGENADVVECCHVLLNACFSESAFWEHGDRR